MNDDANTPENLATAARALVADNRHAVLATLKSDDGYPYSSLVDYLPLADGDLVFLLSQLAEHQHYLSADNRASVLIAPSLGGADRLAQPRVTVLGDVVVENDKSVFREAYLACHPNAVNYIDFTDFNFYRLQVRQLRYIAGFGRMGWLEAQIYHAVPL